MGQMSVLDGTDREVPQTVCIVQARLGSKRLPKKVLSILGDVPLLVHVVRRALCLEVNRVVVAVPVEEYAVFVGVMRGHFTREMDGEPPLLAVIGGPGKDVLERFSVVAERTTASRIVRVTGDCPLFDPLVGNRVIRAHYEHSGMLCTNDTRVSGYWDGLDCEVFNYLSLANAARLCKNAHEREHVTMWMYKYVPHYIVRAPATYPPLKLSVDTEEDFERVQAIMRHLPLRAYDMDSTLVAAIDAGVVAGGVSGGGNYV